MMEILYYFVPVTILIQQGKQADEKEHKDAFTQELQELRQIIWEHCNCIHESLPAFRNSVVLLTISELIFFR